MLNAAKAVKKPIAVPEDDVKSIASSGAHPRAVIINWGDAMEEQKESELLQEKNHKRGLSTSSVASSVIPIINDLDSLKPVIPAHKNPEVVAPEKKKVIPASRRPALCIAVTLLTFAAACALSLMFAFKGAYKPVNTMQYANVTLNGTSIIGLSLEGSSPMTLTTITDANVQSNIATIVNLPLSSVEITSNTASFYNVSIKFTNTSANSDPFVILGIAARKGHYLLLELGVSEVKNLKSGSFYAVCYTCGTTSPPTTAPTELPTEAPTEEPVIPTEAPTEEPVIPTEAPTEEPVIPTEAPTPAATDPVTEQPTLAPTKAPTPVATKAPTPAATEPSTPDPTEAVVTNGAKIDP